MINKHKYELCRLCLCSGGRLINIFEGSSNEDFMVVMTLEDLLHIKVVKEAGYPWLVCNSCVDKLTEFRLFKRRCNECLFVFYNRIHTGAKDQHGDGSGDNPNVSDKKDNDDDNKETIGSADAVSANEWRIDTPLQTTDHSLQRSEAKRLPSFTTRGDTEMRPTTSSPFKELDSIACKEETDSIDIPIDIPVDNSNETADTGGGIGGVDRVLGQERGNTSPMDVNLRPKLVSVAQVAGGDFSSVTVMEPMTSGDPKRTDLLGSLRMPGVETQQADAVECKTEEDSDGDDFGNGELAEGDYVTPGNEALDVQCRAVGELISSLPGPTNENVRLNDESEMSSTARAERCEFESVPTFNDLADDGSLTGKRLPDRRSKKKDFVCDICGSLFGTKLLIEKHMRKHVSDDFFHCETCFMGFIDRGEYEKHCSVPCDVSRSRDTVGSGGIDFFHCSTCLVGFIKKAEYDKHVLKHVVKEEGGGECVSGSVKDVGGVESSGDVFNTSGGLREGCSLSNVDLDGGTSDGVRNQCDFGVDLDGGEFDGGVMSSASIPNDGTDDNCHVCDECGRRFREISDLKDHMSVHSDGKPYPCSICSKSFTRKTNLKTHLALHLADKPYKCNVCPMEFTARAKLTHHMKTHADMLPYTCTVCFKMFSRGRNLKAHMRLHTGEKAFACTVCPKTFRLKNSLTVHLRTHTGEKPYSCEVCGKAFTQSSGLKVHLARHNGEKVHACTECPKAFVERADLRKHMNVHSKEKPYSCHVCSRSFVAERYLNKHMANHTGRKPFSCEICTKTFSIKFSLKAHMVVHDSERPFMCDICSKPFSRKRSLQLHMVVHNDSRYKCEKCPFKSPNKLELRRHVQRLHWVMNPTGDSPDPS